MSDLHYKYKKYKSKYLKLRSQNREYPSEFANEMDQRSIILFGENNSPEYNVEGVGDPRVAFFFKIVRGLSADSIDMYIKEILTLYTRTKDETVLLDLFVIMYHTRDIRSGKGERDIFYLMMIKLYEYYPEIILELLPLVPYYGYYKDYFRMMEIMGDIENSFISKIYELNVIQLNLDTDNYEKAIKDGVKPKISLLAKYIPKEHKHFDNVFQYVDHISLMLYPNITDINERKKMYRTRVSKLNKALKTTEVLMSAKKFSEINFEKVGSKAAFKFRKSFFNIKVNSEIERSIEEDRRKGRENFLKSIVNKNISGKQLEIYEIAKIVMVTKNISKEEEMLFQTQWDKIRENLLNTLKEREKDTDIKGELDIGNLLPIADVSGSMTGLPIYVSVSLSILLSEISNFFKNRIITFSQNPEWIKLDPNANIVEKIKQVYAAGWGTNTNFEATYELIIDVIRNKKLREDQIPELIVFSDMQFDSASGEDKYKTHHQIMVDKFQNLGIEISGKPYKLPRIIYWNLRADTIGFPVQANTPNVEMISGFSSNLLKHIFSGNIKKGFQIPTPYDTFRNIVDDDKYSIVREIVKATKSLSN